MQPAAEEHTVVVGRDAGAVVPSVAEPEVEPKALPLPEAHQSPGSPWVVWCPGCHQNQILWVRKNCRPAPVSPAYGINCTSGLQYCKRCWECCCGQPSMGARATSYHGCSAMYGSLGSNRCGILATSFHGVLGSPIIPRIRRKRQTETVAVDRLPLVRHEITHQNTSSISDLRPCGRWQRSIGLTIRYHGGPM